MPETLEQLQSNFHPLTVDEIEQVCDPKNEKCAFYGYVGNEAAVRIAVRFAKQCFGSLHDVGLARGKWKDPVWTCQREYPVRMLLTGPRSVGKTTFARCYTRLIGTDYKTGQLRLGFAELDGTRIKKPEQVFERIQFALREVKTPLMPTKVTTGMRYYQPPPMVLFVDEIHAMPIKVQECFLKMAEKSDGVFELAGMRLDCTRITIITATTKPGKLDTALKSRFSIKIALEKHTLEEVAKIIRLGREDDWTKAQALRLARMQPIPREAKDIADLIDSTCDTEGCSLEKAMTAVTGDLGLQDGGLSPLAIEVLVSLADSQPVGLSKKNLCAQLENMDESQFEMEIIPQLLRNEFHQSLITISSRHKITEAGLDELRKRSLIEW